MNNKKKLLLSSSLVIAMCSTMITGATFALFSDTEETNITVNAGKVDVVSEITDWSTWSMGVEQTQGEFENGGFADVDTATGSVTLDNVTPGDTFKATVKVTNNSTVNVKYRAALLINGELADYLTVSVNEVTYSAAETILSDWEFVAAAQQPTVNEMALEIALPDNVGNDAQTLSATVKIRVEAIQGNTKLTDEWDGTADTSWYNDTATEFSLDASEQLAGLADLVDAGNDFAGKTIKLESDMDLQDKLFNPIGSYRKEQSFKGTFDGQGYAISNLSQNTWDLDNGYYYGDLGLGLFGKVEDATIKNLKVDGASISGESAICGVVAATAYGDCTFENITVSNANCADYQYYAGGIVGWASGNHTYKNCVVDETNNIAAQWGDFDNSIGGVIGGAGGSAEILLEDCTVSCRIDAYNDVTSSYQWYAYRRAGMLIGNTGMTKAVDGRTYADAPQLTCKNVTVIYGEWANYTYCEFAGTSWPYVRVQAGVSNSAYSNPRYGHPTDANGNEVVDDNHVHNDGEDHHILCVFDQLYGGGQGVYGTATHDGVTVVYNNK